MKRRVYYISFNHLTQVSDANKTRRISGLKFSIRGRIFEWRKKRRGRKRGRMERILQIRTIWKIVKGQRLRSPPRFGKWILLTGSYALLAVSRRRSCTNRGKRGREETSSEGKRPREERPTGWYEGNEARLMEWKQI